MGEIQHGSQRRDSEPLPKRQKQGSVTDWNQIFTWKADEESFLYLGLNYIGYFDELSCYDRALTDGEVQTLFDLKNDVLSNLRAAFNDYR